MKKAHVFVEGQPERPTAGIVNDRAFAGVAEPEFSLQSAFNALFSGLISPAIFIFEMQGGWKAALKNFAFENIAKSRPETLLLIDFEDRDPGTPKFSDANGKKNLQLLPLIELYLKEAELPDNHQNTALNSIFFMVQAMEAWILSQPAVIELCLGAKNLSNRETFERRKAALIKAPASQTKNPDVVLAQLVRDFKIERQEKFEAWNTTR